MFKADISFDSHWHLCSITDMRLVRRMFLARIFSSACVVYFSVCSFRVFIAHVYYVSVLCMQKLLEQKQQAYEYELYKSEVSVA